jgi:hypothetical protein
MRIERSFAVAPRGMTRAGRGRVVDRCACRHATWLITNPVLGRGGGVNAAAVVVAVLTAALTAAPTAAPTAALTAASVPGAPPAAVVTLVVVGGGRNGVGPIGETFIGCSFASDIVERSRDHGWPERLAFG